MQNKVPAMWPFDSIYTPWSQDPKSSTHNPLTAERKYAPWEEQEIIRNEGNMIFLPAAMYQ